MPLTTGLFTLALFLSPPGGEAASTVSDLADAWVAGFADHDPLEARLWGVATDSERLTTDVSPDETERWRRQQAQWLTELDRIDAAALAHADRAIYINLRDRIETDLALEACHREFWPLNNFSGWHLNLENSLAIALETSSPDTELLRDWAGQIAARLSADAAALEAGLEYGYSVPRPVALIVADQYDGLASPDSPVAALPNGLDPALAVHWSDLFNTVIAPAFARQATYIRDRYAPRARTDLSLSALQDGPACLAASVRRNVGIVMTPGELQALASRLQHMADTRLSELGTRIWGLADPGSVRERIRAMADDDEEIGNESAIIAAAQAETDRLIATSARFFPALPEQQVEVVVYSAIEREGVTASYRPSNDGGFAGTYFLNPDEPRMRTRRSMAAVTSHEVAPGHHMQAMIARAAGTAGGEPPHPILTIGFNNAFVEGWAHYAETLAFEEGLLADSDRTALDFWADFGETIAIESRFQTGAADEAATRQAVLHLRGMPDADPSTADIPLYWMSVMPAQLFSYGLGAEFLYSLRDRARDALGDRFDYPTFHRLVLEDGSVPLWWIEEKVDAWIASGGSDAD
ncbi:MULTISPECIES: DUF885 domain-containing protein [Hyphobacterium]|uniref:DUF885 domain-containing protein n=1 Tax=Hyphobacterium vulgare TaxID=1736751 RepID=A0ABV6ZWJ1_9PROT